MSATQVRTSDRAELLTAVFKVVEPRKPVSFAADGLNTLCVLRYVRLENGLSRGAAVERLLREIGKEHQARQVLFQFWCDTFMYNGGPPLELAGPKPLAVTKKDTRAFARELSDAYSTDNYRGGWAGCIRMLRRRGLNDRQVEAVIRSKWTRWASDAAKNPSRCTGQDLARFMDDKRNQCTPEAISELVEGTFQ